MVYYPESVLPQRPDHDGVNDQDEDEQIQREQQPDVDQLEVARLRQALNNNH